MRPRLGIIVSTLLAAGFVAGAGCASAFAEEAMGPPNLLKTMATPFGAPSATPGDLPAASTGEMTLPPRRSLLSRLTPTRIYLPARMVIGQPSEFIVQGQPGRWVAIAMADRDNGAKPVYGQAIRLGPDRKLMSLGKIPDGGVLSLSVEMPVHGDLIGQSVYFEGVVWTQPDFSDLEVAQTQQAGEAAPTHTPSPNGVLVAAEQGKLRMQLKGETPLKLQELHGRRTGYDSGRP